MVVTSLSRVMNKTGVLTITPNAVQISSHLFPPTFGELLLPINITQVTNNVFCNLKGKSVTLIFYARTNKRLVFSFVNLHSLVNYVFLTNSFDEGLTLSLNVSIMLFVSVCDGNMSLL